MAIVSRSISVSKKKRRVCAQLACTVLALWLPALTSARGDSLTIAHPMSDVCSLLSEATASAILGGPAQTQTTDPATICEWKPRNPGSAAQPLWISLEWPGPSEVDRLAQLPDFGVPALSVQAVTALPAKALWTRLRDRAFTDYALVVLTSSMKMTVYTSVRDDAIRIAREALGNIGSTP